MPINCSNAHMRIRSARRRRAMIVAVGQSACLPLRIQRNLEEQTALGALNDDEKRSGCEHGHSERQEKLFFFSLLLAKPPHRRFPLAAGALLRNSSLHTDSRTGTRTGQTASAALLAYVTFSLLAVSMPRDGRRGESVREPRTRIPEAIIVLYDLTVLIDESAGALFEELALDECGFGANSRGHEIWFEQRLVVFVVVTLDSRVINSLVKGLFVVQSMLIDMATKLSHSGRRANVPHARTSQSASD